MSDERINYNEILFESIDTIVKSRLQDLNFNKTVIGTIYDDRKRKDGHYIVKVENLKLDVYSESDKYNNGDQVSILIPNGDYGSDQKIILSRYRASQDIQPITYTPPFQELVLMSENLTSDISEQILIANATKDTAVSESKMTEIQLKEIPFQGIEQLAFTSLGIKASFMCSLQNYNITKGEYGLRFSIKGHDRNLNLKEINRYFSSKEMFGNPYGYINYTVQEKKINLTDIDFSIDTIAIFFYQNGKFTAGLTELIKSEINQIAVKNIELYYANDITLRKNQTFEIGVQDLTYIAGEKKEISYFWYNIDNQNHYLGDSDGSNYQIKWYRDYQGIWIEDSSLPIDQDTFSFGKIPIPLRDNVKRERIKGILYRNFKNNESESENLEITYESNILTFENLSIKEDPLIADKINALNIKLGENTERVFSFYGENNLLINPNESQINRELILEYNPSQVNISEDLFFKNAKIFWYIPRENTMINFNKDFLNENFICFTEEDYQNNFQNHIDKIVLQNEVSKENVKTGYFCFLNRKKYSDKYKTFSFLVKDFYSKNATNNEIKCEVAYDDAIYKTQIFFIFSSQSENGDVYTPVIYSTNNRNTIDKDEPYLVLNVSLLSPKGEEINISSNNIVWESLDNSLILDNSISASRLEIKNPYLENRYGVIKATVKINSEIIVSSFYPIIYSKNNEYYAAAPSSIIYNQNGISPKYYKEKLCLYKNLDNTEIKGVVWEIVYVDKKTHQVVSNEKLQNILKFLPQIHQNHILAPLFFIQDTGVFSILKGKVNNEIVWEQPLLILCETFSENKWGKDFIIKPNEATIFNLSFGFGKINSNNSLNGVFLGEVGNITSKEFGLFCFDENNQICKIVSAGQIQIGPNNNNKIFSDKDFLSIQTENFFLTSDKTQEFFKISNNKGYISATPNELKGSFTSLETQQLSIQGTSYSQKEIPILNLSTETTQSLKDIDIVEEPKGTVIGHADSEGNVSLSVPIISSITKKMNPVQKVKVLVGG